MSKTKIGAIPRQGCELNQILSGKGTNSADDQHEEEDQSTALNTSRVRPLELLSSDPNARFLFLTDGVLAKGLSPLRVDEPWFEPREVALETMPERLKNAATGVPGRVGVLQQHPLQLVQTEADRILRECLHIPHAARKSCLASIIDRVRLAMIDSKTARITADELRSLVEQHGLPPENEPFAEPTIFDAIRQHLEHRSS